MSKIIKKQTKGIHCNNAIITHILYCLTYIFIYDLRNLEVALGDYILNKDPDCTRNSIARLCHPPKIVRKVNDVVIHENYDPTNNYNNIALIRLEELVPLHTEDPIRHSINIISIISTVRS